MRVGLVWRLRAKSTRYRRLLTGLPVNNKSLWYKRLLSNYLAFISPIA